MPRLWSIIPDRSVLACRSSSLILSLYINLLYPLETHPKQSARHPRKMASTDRLGGYAPGDSNYNQLKFALQATYDYFDYFWRGEGRCWNISERRPHFMNSGVPKTRIRPPRVSRPGREQPVRQHIPFGRLALRQERPGAVAQVEQQIQQGYFPVKAALDPLDLNISKILGWGGQAVAVLVELLGEDGQREKVVVKCQRPQRSNLASEIAYMDVSTRPFSGLA